METVMDICRCCSPIKSVRRQAVHATAAIRLALVQNHKKNMYNFADWISIDLDEGEVGCKNELFLYHQIITGDFLVMHVCILFFIS